MLYVYKYICLKQQYTNIEQYKSVKKKLDFIKFYLYTFILPWVIKQYEKYTIDSFF